MTIEVGQKFERLTTVKPVSNKKWICKCDCGNEVTVYGYNLKRGHNRSCGCLRYALKNQIYIRPYVFKNLAEHGNTVLSKKVYYKLGHDEVIKQFKEKGFDVDIEVVYHNDYAEDDTFSCEEWKSIIVRVKE